MFKKKSIKLGLDRTLFRSSFWQIGLLLLLTVGMFLILGGILYFFSSLVGHPKGMEDVNPWWQVYYYYIDSGNQMSMDAGKTTTTQRVIALFISTLGSIFVGGMLISTITNIIERRVEQTRTGTNYYKFKDHIVIIGSDQMVTGIINQILEKSPDVCHIVLLTSQNVEQLRQSIDSSLHKDKLKSKIVVNYGRRDSKEYLKKINITKAREVFILGDDSEFDDIESFHDSLNVQCLRAIAELCEADGRTGLRCNVSFEYKTTHHVFRYADLPDSVMRHIDFHPFNFYELWAQKVMLVNHSEQCNIDYLPLDYRAITSTDSDEYVHLIIIGNSKMGQAFALQAAHIAHYPNYRRRKTRITIIDREMHREMDELRQKSGELFEVSKWRFIDANRWEREGGDSPEPYTTESEFDWEKYEHLVHDKRDPWFIDLEWTFIEGDDCNPKVRKLLTEYALDNNAIVTVAVCLNITNRSLRSAMYLPKVYYEKEIPILVQQRKTASLVNTINGSELDQEKRAEMLYRNLKPFGMLYDCYDLDMAMGLRYSRRINAAYNYYDSNHTTPTTIDDDQAEQMWRKLPTTKRWSNMYCAAHIPTKLRSAGYSHDKLAAMSDLSQVSFTEEQIAFLAEMEHARWNVEELLLGYRMVTKDEQDEIDADYTKKDSYRKRRIHYDIRPFDGLRPDPEGKTPSVYDIVIVRSIPAIISKNR